MFEGNEYVKAGGRSLVEFMWVEYEAKAYPWDGMLDSRDVGNLEGSGER